MPWLAVNILVKRTCLSFLGQFDLSAQSYEYIIRILYTYRYVFGTNCDISVKILIEPYFTHIRTCTGIRIDKLAQKSMWSLEEFESEKINYSRGIIYLKVHVYWIVFDRLSDKGDITWNIALNFHRKLVLKNNSYCSDQLKFWYNCYSNVVTIIRLNGRPVRRNCIPDG